MKALQKAFANAKRGNKDYLLQISNATGLKRSFLNSVVNNSNGKYRRKYVDRLYKYFNLPIDKRYKKNLRARERKTYSVIGNIFRLARTRKGYTIEEVATIVKWDKRQLFRIEQWDSLPSIRSYYVVQLLKLYEFSEEEEEKIKWGIAILQDLCKIANKYEQLTE